MLKIWISILVIGLIAGALIYRRTSQVSTGSVDKAPLMTVYKNPFDKKSQYINPLAVYKNPFDVIRAEETK